jgi:MFS family permease
MGFQFQSVPALTSDLTADLGLSFAFVGTLIGLYLLPGAVIAFPGGWLGQRFGDKRIVLYGLAMMTVGGAILGASTDTSILLMGRVLSGTGAVLLNVLLTKMVADWFGEREIVTAMGILIVSWPLGIALAMLSLPTLADLVGLAGVMYATAAVSLLCLALVAGIYGSPEGRSKAPASSLGSSLTAHEWTLAILAGLVWTLYNAGLILILAFGPNYLSSTGVTTIAAAAIVSLVGWLIIPSLAAGGWIAQRLGRPNLIMVSCLTVAALLTGTAALGITSPILFVALGLIFGPPGPIIMTLPVQAVRAERRSIGLGIYFTCYYIGMALAPPIAGTMRDIFASATAPIWTAVVALVLAVVALALYRFIQGTVQVEECESQ